MSLVSLVIVILVLAGLGVLLWLVMKLPMPAEFKQILPVLAAILVVVFLILWLAGYVSVRGP